MKRIVWLLSGLCLCAPLFAQAQDAYVVADISLQAGPDPEYPSITELPAGTPVSIQGCIDGYTWCDVVAGDDRGWVAGSFLEEDFDNQRVIVVDYGPRIHIPVVSFSLGAYWERHYHNRPWFAERQRWETRHIQPHALPKPAAVANGGPHEERRGRGDHAGVHGAQPNATMGAQQSTTTGAQQSTTTGAQQSTTTSTQQSTTTGAQHNATPATQPATRPAANPPATSTPVPAAKNETRAHTEPTPKTEPATHPSDEHARAHANAQEERHDHPSTAAPATNAPPQPHTAPQPKTAPPESQHEAGQNQPPPHAANAPKQPPLKSEQKKESKEPPKKDEGDKKSGDKNGDAKDHD
jgi:uncharacterized protein YraI